MELAVNYSYPAAELQREGRIAVDRFKCPAWPALVTSVQEEYPLYIHFPLKVGAGIGDAVDTETKKPADWGKIEALLTQTGTPLLNVHLTLAAKDYPHISPTDADPALVEMLTERTVRDVQAVVRRFGAEMVIAENDHGGKGVYLHPTVLPQFINGVIEETGCGFLLDISHARLAAHSLGVDAREYINSLPVKRIRELHITGIQRVEGRWLELARRAGLDPEFVQRYAGQLVDHLPMTEADWDFFAWAMAQVRSGAWGRPWVAAFEFGGVGGLWQLLADKDVLAEQLPRLSALAHGQE